MDYWQKEVYKESVAKSTQAVIDREKLRDKKILVTGASGLIGSFVTDILLALRAKVYAAGRNPEFFHKRFGGAEALWYDLNETIAFEEEFDYVIHAAGYGHPKVFAENPVGTLNSIIGGTDRLLRYSMDHRVRKLLYISSGEVYGGVDSMNPRGCYPVGKRAAECLCASYTKQYGLDTVVARLCHTFGPGASKTDNRAATEFLQKASRGEDIVLKSRGEQLRSYLYSADSASAILSVLISGKTRESYDIASEDNVVTISGLAELIADAFGVSVRYDIPTESEKREQTPIKTQVLDGAKIKKLGWQGRYTLSEGVREISRLL
ncbi:MAG: NAD(P)-dependent oxidoreductase [Lachnospiraceae bacterium]|nr:NAD(P)-dependent oxidoreductase [Lachnospiraceae bacterium]